MRSYLLQPRWIPWHILCLVISVVFIRLGWWQWDSAHRQQTLDWQNAAYAVQWIVFVGFVGWFWYKVIADQRTVEAQRDEELVD
jgi:TRAP-type C4-dicarboxylate transport system permease small subunit